MRGLPLTIIGVEEKRGSMFGDSFDRNVYMPITLHLQLFDRGGGIQVHGKSADRESLTIAIEDARTESAKQTQTSRQR